MTWTPQSPVVFPTREEFEADDPRHEYLGPGEGPADDEIQVFRSRWSQFPGEWQVIWNKESGVLYLIEVTGEDPSVIVVGHASSRASLWEALGGDPLGPYGDKPGGIDQLLAALGVPPIGT